MKKRKLAIAIALMMALFMCVETTAVNAASLSEIRRQIEENQNKLNEGQAKEQSLAAKVTELETSIVEGEAKLKVLEKELKAAEEKVNVQNDNLNARLRNMYKSGSIGFFDVLMESTSFSEFLTNLDMVEKIYSSDKTVLEDLQAAYDEVDKKKKEVETLQAELKESKALAEKQKSEIAASNEETEKMLDELQAEADKMTQVIVSQGSSSSTSKYTGGAMAWPVPSSSSITSYFGYRYHPLSGVYKYHTGLDIGASSGAAVVAANSGTVIMAGWNGGYGYCVIIDHGGGISTLYGHNSSLLVSSGQRVSRGQQIARAGSTGNSTGPHCHFEVRQNGNYVNPLPYVQ